MLTYSLRLTDDYAVEALRSHRANAPLHWVRWPIKAVCAVGLLLLAAVGFGAKVYEVALVAVVFLGLLIAGPRLDYWLLRHRYRRHAQYGLETKVVLAEESLRFDSRDYNSEVLWSAFLSASEFPAGLLLYRGPSDYIWLPDSAIVDGSPGDARALTRSRIGQYHVV